MSNKRVVIIVEGGVADYVSDPDVGVLLLDVDIWQQNDTGYEASEVAGFEDLVPEWIKNNYLIEEENSCNDESDALISESDSTITLTGEKTMYINDEKQEVYKQNGGGICPHCGSDRLDSECTNVEMLKVDVFVSCNDCGSTWYDEYSFTGVSSFNLGSKQLTEEQQAFIKTYSNNVGCVDEDTLVDFFLHEHDYDHHVESRNHISDCWLLWQSAVGYAKKQENV